VSFSLTKKGLIGIEIHHGVRKNVAALRTVRTLINNLIIGVTKGFKYKMRYVYAHFPINVNLDQNSETGNWEVEIRYVTMERAPGGLGLSGDGRGSGGAGSIMLGHGNGKEADFGCAAVTSSARRSSGGS
jgi:hypothetical protein